MSQPLDAVGRSVALRRFGVAIGTVLALAAFAVPAVSASSGTPTVPPQKVDDSSLTFKTTVDGGASGVLPTTRTVPHWWGSTLDPADGLVYGYNMVGADPNACSGASCDVTVQVDITPVVVNLDGMTFSGSDVVAPTLASPLFSLNDYGTTPFVSTGSAPWSDVARGSGGVLSQGDVGRPLQLLDATMRAQFNRTGDSSYHLRLQPNVLPPVTIDVPQSQGYLLQSGRGVVFAVVAGNWWAPQIHNLETSADPTHLALYLTDDTTLQFGKTFAEGCCVWGYHGGMQLGRHSVANGNSAGNAPVQTFAWASFISPGVYARPNGGNYWAFQDIFALSHELSEWADDPFASNFPIEPWPIFVGQPSFSCSNYLEVGDAMGFVGFAMGSNSFRQGPNPNGTESADGYYHPEDEATLAWMMRLNPNLVSEPTQTPSINIGRYTFLGDLNTFGLDQPPPACIG
jgi:hypothetical protein